MYQSVFEKSFRNLYAPLCGIFHPNSVVVARKFHRNLLVHKKFLPGRPDPEAAGRRKILQSRPPSCTLENSQGSLYKTIVNTIFFQRKCRKNSMLADCTNCLSKCGKCKWWCKSYPLLKSLKNIEKSSYTQSYPHYPHG